MNDSSEQKCFLHCTTWVVLSYRSIDTIGYRGYSGTGIHQRSAVAINSALLANKLKELLKTLAVFAINCTAVQST